MGLVTGLFVVVMLNGFSCRYKPLKLVVRPLLNTPLLRLLAVVYRPGQQEVVVSFFMTPICLVVVIGRGMTIPFKL